MAPKVNSRELEPAQGAAPDGAIRPTTDVSVLMDPQHEDIAAEAYALWAARGYQDGSDIDDWLEAEQRLRDAAREGGEPPEGER